MGFSKRFAEKEAFAKALGTGFRNNLNFKDIEVSCPVILDCTYVSSTNIQRIDVPTNTEQVFFSFSKGFGLIGQRLGLVYTKKPHPTLDLLKWFSLNQYFQ